MPKLNAMKYITASGERRINCYRIIIPKEVVKDAAIKDTDDLIVRAAKNKIIIEKK